MLGVFIGFFSTICYGFSALVDSHISNSLFKKSSVIMFFNTLTNIIGLPFLFFFGVPEVMPWDVLPWFIGVILICLLYQIPYYKAMQSLDASVSSALLQFGSIIIPFLSYFWLGDKLTAEQYAGFAIVVAASVILNLNFKAKFKLNQGFWLMLGVSLMLALRIVLCKYILDRISWVSVVFYRIMIENLLLLPVLLLPVYRRNIREAFPVYLKNWRYFLFNELLDQSANFSGKYALSVLSAVIMAAIRATRPIFILLTAFIMKLCHSKTTVKEEITWHLSLKKLVCFTFIIAGVLMVLHPY